MAPGRENASYTVPGDAAMRLEAESTLPAIALGHEEAGHEAAAGRHAYPPRTPVGP